MTKKKSTTKKTCENKFCLPIIIIIIIIYDFIIFCDANKVIRQFFPSLSSNTRGIQR